MNPSSKTNDFFRAVFDAHEVGITLKNIEKILN
jgi:hypothetical protein